MSRAFVWVLIAIGFSLTTTTSLFAESTRSCTLTIESKLRSGEVRTVKFVNPTPSREECAHRAKLHSTNFEPREVASKKVSYQWGQR